MARQFGEEILHEPVSAHMQRDLLLVQETQTVAAAIRSLRAQPPTGRFFYLYVINLEGQLVGVLPTRNLLVSAGDAVISSIMDPRVVAIPDSATVLEACEFFIQHRFLALPVMDAERRPLGLVDVELFTDEVFDVAEQRSRNDVFQLIGIHVRRNERVAPWSGFRDRFPWLIANIIGGALCALLTRHFEGLLAAAIAVAMFVPIVLTLSESVSIQSMSILLQGLHGSRIDWRFVGGAVARELAVALLLGAVTGALVGTVGWLWLGSSNVGIALALSITLAIMSAGLMGLLLPILVRAVRADPRIAAGPIVLAATDVITLLFYFAISAHLLAP